MILVNSMNLQSNVLKNNQLLIFCIFIRLLQSSRVSDEWCITNRLIAKQLLLFFLFRNVPPERNFFSKRELLNKSVNCIGG